MRSALHVNSRATCETRSRASAQRAALPAVPHAVPGRGSVARLANIHRDAACWAWPSRHASGLFQAVPSVRSQGERKCKTGLIAKRTCENCRAI